MPDADAKGHPAKEKLMPFALNQLPGDDDLESQTKADLLEEAASLDISGRSNMTKEELVDAIREARGEVYEQPAPVGEERRDYPREERPEPE